MAGISATCYQNDGKDSKFTAFPFINFPKMASVQLVIKTMEKSASLPLFPLSISQKCYKLTPIAGDYTLLSVPWARGASVTFNDTTASTLSTVGNAALFLGGLYLLSGFPAAASALADPFGISRRLGVAAPTRTARPRAGAPAPRFQHRISKGEEGFMKKPSCFTATNLAAHFQVKHLALSL